MYCPSKLAKKKGSPWRIFITPTIAQPEKYFLVAGIKANIMLFRAGSLITFDSKKA